MLNEDLDDGEYGTLVEALTLSPASRAVELGVNTYRAEVVRVDRRLDLALLGDGARRWCNDAGDVPIVQDLDGNRQAASGNRHPG